MLILLVYTCAFMANLNAREALRARWAEVSDVTSIPVTDVPNEDDTPTRLDPSWSVRLTPVDWFYRPSTLTSASPPS